MPLELTFLSREQLEEERLSCELRTSGCFDLVSSIVEHTMKSAFEMDVRCQAVAPGKRLHREHQSDLNATFEIILGDVRGVLTVCFDPSLLHHLFSRLLAREDQIYLERSRLTPAERGLFKYIALRLAFHAKQVLALKTPVVVRWQGKLETATQKDAKMMPFMELQLDSRFEVHLLCCDRLRPLLISAISSTSTADASSSVGRSSEQIRFHQRQVDHVLDRISDILHFNLVVTLVHTRLDVAEVMSLDIGDILFFETSSVRLSDGVATGEVFCCLQTEPSMVWRAQLRTSSQGAYMVELSTASQDVELMNEDDGEELNHDDAEHASLVDAIRSGAAIANAASEAAAATATEQNALENEQVTSLRDNVVIGKVQVHLQVELARVKMSLKSLAALSSGQVIELACGPKDPVFLVVGNRRVGSGELVNVDGRLGVRVLSLLDD
jgi:type III secretion system YscQ/HrcQ family protein